MSDENFNFSKQEQETLKYWKKNRCFEKSNELSKERKRYVFYDGPPFATGLPHYGHILSGTIKDTVGRFYYQKGHHVERRFGWDCHGLPVEYEIDKMLKITTRDQVHEMGIKAYNDHCRSIVQKYTSEWEEVVDRMGRWVNFQGGYKTMDMKFMESVWFIFKSIFDRNKIYRGFKIMPFSIACKTPLSNFEASQNYKDVSDPSILVRFPVLHKEDRDAILKKCNQTVHNATISFVAWTTTPWTLPASLGLCLNSKFTYALFYLEEDYSNIYIIHSNRIGAYFKKYKIIAEISGAEIVGVEYEQPFTCYEKYRAKGCFRTIDAAFVSEENGSAIVQCAPAFGEDDYATFLSKNILQSDEVVPCHVDENGNFTIPLEKYMRVEMKLEKTLKEFYFKDADKIILSILKERLLMNSRIVHSYPFCWRSDTPLMYKLVPNWFIRVKETREELLKQNEKINWIPEDIKYKRFHNWLAAAKDWAVSRNRFWGTPLPIWARFEGACYDYNDLICIGSVKELEELSGVKVADLHRETVDDIVIKRDGKKYRRIEEVLDCWFESGSMPYAQDNLDGIGESGEKLTKTNFPANFIGEGLDQTRGWFYTLHVISTILFDSPAFKNVVVNGIVLADDGKKMSKRLKNYPSTHEIFKKYGADALRLYLISSPVVAAENLRFNESGVREMLKTVLIPWHNIILFYNETKKSVTATNTLLDSWIESELNSFISEIDAHMASYKLNGVLDSILKFIDNLSNWYIRINRKELKSGGKYLAEIIKRFSITMASFTPFFAEYSYQSISDDSKMESVHFEMIPPAKCFETDFGFAKEIIEGIRHLREKHSLKLRRVLKRIKVAVNKSELDTVTKLVAKYEGVIKNECNVLDVVVEELEANQVEHRIKPNYRILSQDKSKMKQKIDIITKLNKQELKTIQDNQHPLVKSNEIMVETEFVGVDHSCVCQINSNSVGLVLDVTENDLIREMSFARDFYSFVQKMRKNLKLKVSDKIVVEIENKAVRDKFERVIGDHYKNEIDFRKNESCVNQVGETDYKYDDIETGLKLFRKE
ncbi:putative isoleucine--tRNA ligase, cytoplasmic [Enterospora canceri]|uniref:Probable isoleucine--tRNA ligase, cytoplasmic n=1 Tax=Enterospora canceri TaxID=1081671 RepID=A0A1Y1SAC4_9MICR|nr:putative isoleucine--tRNA ligase, cytoplasmic [Enterospora canceri]